MTSTLCPAHAPALGTSKAAVATPARSITRLPVKEGLLRFRNDRAGLLAKLGDERVDIARSALGPLGIVYVTEAGLARRLLTELGDAFTKGPAIGRQLTYLVGNGLLSCHDDDHRTQRKLLAPKFQPRQIVRFAQTMIEHAEAMLTRWRWDTAPGTPIDIDSEVNALTVAIAARTMFGADISRAEIDMFREGLEFANHWTIGRATSPIRLPRWAPTPSNRKIREVKRSMDVLMYRIIAERRAEGEQACRDRADVLSALMDARDEDGVGMSDDLIRDQIITFLLAGHETTGITLSWMFRLLAERPDVADRIAAEADAVFGPLAPGRVGISRAMKDIDARQLTYTRAAVQETMRLRTPSYMIGRQARQDVELDGYRIRKGDFLVINTLGMHRRSDYFEDPLAFRCERFLDKPAWPRTAYAPFGAGRRVCIGSHFALLELTLIMALACRAMRLPRGDHNYLDERTAQARDGFDATSLITLQPTDSFKIAPMWRTA